MLAARVPEFRYFDTACILPASVLFFFSFIALIGEKLESSPNVGYLRVAFF